MTATQESRKVMVSVNLPVRHSNRVFPRSSPLISEVHVPRLPPDHETAESAVRNLNGTDVGGRPLRIDMAESDPLLEGKTTNRGELIPGENDGSSSGYPEPRRLGDRSSDSSTESIDLSEGLPPGRPPPPGVSTLDAISQNLATMDPTQLTEVLAQMKVPLHPSNVLIFMLMNIFFKGICDNPSRSSTSTSTYATSNGTCFISSPRPSKNRRPIRSGTYASRFSFRNGGKVIICPLILVRGDAARIQPYLPSIFVQ